MDKIRAHQWFASLIGQEIGGWAPQELAGHGKSAIVVKAVRDGLVGALKLFEPELVERFGPDNQLERIRRETSLIGKSIANLVSILDGGRSGRYFFVVMEYLAPPWRPLSERLTDVPRERIWTLISRIADAAKGLEDNCLVHRDIKPENVMVTEDFSALKVMDLGVMRPIGAASITDEISRPFIGTLRYSSPEFLLREEDDTMDGWRAVTFYQLGGILHDLIMRRRLFAEFSEPYARLARAVEEQIPTIDAPDVHTDLLLLARNCLLKDPRTRLECVRWDNFHPPETAVQSPAESARERVKQRRLVGGQSRTTTVQSEAQSRRLVEQAKEVVLDSLKSAIRETMAVDEFPVFELVDYQTGRPETGRFCLRFGPSAEHSVRSSVQVIFEVTILDPTERACRIDRHQPRFAEQPDDSGAKCEPLFIGVFEHESVRVNVRDHLYLLMDQIQQDRMSTSS